MTSQVDYPIYFNNGYFRVTVITVLVLCIVLIAMQFTKEVNWDLADFIVMAVLMLSLGSGFVSVLRRFPQKIILLATVFSLTLLYLWTELAVGILF